MSTNQSTYKIIPTVEDETRPYWEGCRQGKLLLQRCAKCREYQFYPRGFCGECYNLELDWEASSGIGTVWTYTITYRNRDPLFHHMVPYVLAYVELEEGIKMMTNIVDCVPESVYIGMQVEVKFENVTDEIAIPLFRPRN